MFTVCVGGCTVRRQTGTRPLRLHPGGRDGAGQDITGTYTLPTLLIAKLYGLQHIHVLCAQGVHWGGRTVWNLQCVCVCVCVCVQVLTLIWTLLRQGQAGRPLPGKVRL